MKENIRLSVVICTRNRSLCLERCLDSLALQTAEAGVFEILVIDNGSTDDTVELLNTYKKRIGNLSVYVESRVGLSVARNRAIKESCGDLIAYIDDDAIAEERWVERIIDCWDIHQPDCLGGSIIPIWEVEKPRWLHKSLEGSYSVMEYAKSSCFMENGDHPWGANIIFNKQSLINTGGFPEDLGRVGGKLLSGEEKWVCEKIYANNGKIWYEPRIQVQHFVPKERLNPAWIRRRIYWGGMTEALYFSKLENIGIKECRSRGWSKFCKTIVSPKVVFWLIMSLIFPSAISKGKKGLFRVGYIKGLLTIEKQ